MGITIINIIRQLISAAIYIDSVEEKAIVIETKGISEDLRNWLKWARKKAAWHDPFIECHDELLNEVDRETLTLKQKPPYYSW